MRRITLVLLIFLIVAIPLWADTVDFIGEGDSIGLGFNGKGTPFCGDETTDPANGFWPYLGGTYSNDAKGGDKSSDVASQVADIVAGHTFTKYYLHVGINNILWDLALADYLTDLGTIKTAVQTKGELIIDQILPTCYVLSGDICSKVETIKKWNAGLEEWCRTNSIKLVNLYQDFCESSTTAEGIDWPTKSCDLLHPRQAGYAYGSTFFAHAAVPSQKRVWGATSYPDFGHVSWKWWVLTGAAIQGNSDTGELVLDNGDSAAGTVECLPTGSKTINLAASAYSGACNISYRTSASTIFYRGSAGAWTSYTGAFSTTDQFIQVKVDNSSSPPAVVKYVAMTWSGSAPDTETDSEPPHMTNSSLHGGAGIR